MPTLKEIINGFDNQSASHKPSHKPNGEIETLSEHERVEYEERAAIMEYDGGLPRSEAERLALEIVVKRRTEEW